MCIRDSFTTCRFDSAWLKKTVPGSEDASVGIQHGSAGGTVRRLRVHALTAVSYTHLRAHETVLDLVCRLLLEKKKKQRTPTTIPSYIKTYYMLN